MSTLSVKFNPKTDAPTVNPNVYGHFAEHLGRCIYEGFWVGEDSEIPNTRGIRNDVVNALKELKIPVLRWPGGCFADEYHWKDGIGPRENRPSILNTHWGRVVENNHFGTHEFFDLCELLETDPYVCGNVGSGTVQEMMEWVEYISSDSLSPMANWRRANGREEPWKLPFFGVGNESWGCGGNMRPEYYADEYRRYNCFVKNYSGNKVYRIACGANSGDLHWTEVMMERAKDHMDGLSLHYYSVPNGWPPNGSATQFNTKQWAEVMKAALHMGTLLEQHTAIMDKYDPEKKVGLIVDEWGTWFESEPGSTPGFLYQQNSMRDAVLAAIHFHLFHAYADRIHMANIAQTVNVLQAMILTDKEKMIKTPTYWVFEMFKHHQGGQVVPMEVEIPTITVEGIELPAISISATAKNGVQTTSIANLDPDNDRVVELPVGGVLEVRVLTGKTMTAHNTFEEPENVKPTSGIFEVGNGVVTVTLPKYSIVTVSSKQ
jgi:alpha-N-arabinofuranosidase